ncbi:hypothetical protein P2O74_13450 [Escherichia coli]|nr:hypothetical protein [Escherichia coli]
MALPDESHPAGRHVIACYVQRPDTSMPGDLPHAITFYDPLMDMLG